MAFRKISYLIPSCDGCGLAWSFGDPACADGIPPHFAARAAALAQLPTDYGWQVRPRRLGRPLMACRRCAAAGVLPDTPGRGWLMALYYEPSEADVAARPYLLATIGLQFTVPSAEFPEPPATSAALLSAGQQAVAVVVAELNRIVGPVLAAGLGSTSPSAGRAG